MEPAFIHETLRETVYSYLRKQIISMELRPGDRINEKLLADTLNVSRGPLREALRQLEQEGLVEYSRNRGCRVREFTVSMAREVFLIRAALEAASCRYLNGAVPAETLDRLEALLAQMKPLQGNSEESLADFIQLDQDFHSAIAAVSGLPMLYNAWDNHTPLNLVLLLTEKRESLRLEAQYDRHKLVLDALRTGRTCDIVDALYKHYQDYSAINF